MTRQTQGLEIQQGGGLHIAGEAIDGFDMVRFRGLVRDPSSALATTIAVAKQGHRFEVHATRALPIFVLTNFGLPVNVVQVASRAWIVWFGRFLFPGHLNILGTFQHIAVANADIIAPTVLANALGRCDVVTATQRLDGDPECVIVQLVRHAVEVMSDPVIVGPSDGDC